MTPRTRLSILALILGAPFVFVVLRLTQLQIRDADRYETLSIDRRRAVHQTEPRRGRILDRRGEMLATRKSTYDLYFALGELHPRELTFSQLENNLGLCAAKAAVADGKVSVSCRRFEPGKPIVKDAMCTCGLLEDMFHKRCGSARDFEFRTRQKGRKSEVWTLPFLVSRKQRLAVPRGLRASMRDAGHEFQKVDETDEQSPYRLRLQVQSLFAMELTLLRLHRQTGIPYERLRQVLFEAKFDVQAGKDIYERGRLREEKRPLIRDVPLALVTEVLYYPENYPGIHVRTRHRRHYPLGEAASLVTGYLIRIPEKRREQLRQAGWLLDGSHQQNIQEFYERFVDDPTRFMAADAEIGEFGIEASYDGALRGSYGLRIDVRDAHNRISRQSDSSFEPRPTITGRSIQTTLDGMLQERIYRELEAQCRSMGNGVAASVVVMDLGERHPKGIPGSMLALCAYPGIDPNRAREPGYFKFLEEDPYLAKARPQFKRPYQAVISPGSIFKLIVALAALEDGIEYVQGDRVQSRPLRSDEELPCRKVFDEKNPHFFRCTSSNAHGDPDGMLDLSQALKHSCNTYFYYLGRDRLRARELAHWASQFGLGRPVKIDVDLPVAKQTQVTAGILDRGDLSRREMMSYAIGHVHVGVSPMQVLRMVAGIALDGRVPWPFLVEAREPEVVALRHPESLAAIRQGMRRVFEEPGGTAHKPEYSLDAFSAAAKTGTAQIDRAGLIYNAWIVGYAPAENPSIAWVVSIEKTPYLGGSATAPITEIILKHFGASEPDRFYRPGLAPPVFEPSEEEDLVPANFREGE